MGIVFVSNLALNQPEETYSFLSFNNDFDLFHLLLPVFVFVLRAKREHLPPVEVKEPPEESIRYHSPSLVSALFSQVPLVVFLANPYVHLLLAKKNVEATRSQG